MLLLILKIYFNKWNVWNHSATCKLFLINGNKIYYKEIQRLFLGILILFIFSLLVIILSSKSGDVRKLLGKGNEKNYAENLD